MILKGQKGFTLIEVIVVAADPWGGKYYLNAKQFNTTRIVWIISAGPNGIMETYPKDTMQHQGDDIGIVIQPGIIVG